MCELLLVEASKKYERQAMVYRQDYIYHGEKHINGSSNRASAKVAIKNGGILSGEGFDEESRTITEIYWIDLL